ncbi:MAG: DEAD/DEAH box helicase [Candidatus Magasanikbacteria bacterium CG11_big_fil_rev_8_21_14_0_20_39_34]|uniref:DEAD/DEAH box helicase n=1 Tax=Candidatus Magasanikbacteria bacterium CG11_big_fil_rev_8_21_14_0_20_39_34 TaxID=1974653 RepID=A0A2H0N3W6_9BACT|nr:MAG: DEAD/DEAH box helicase [Candidatus Magasanikbacteria bacterium CG11_big_fil_rev_8_21_14_0_20_39_34]
MTKKEPLQGHFDDLGIGEKFLSVLKDKGFHNPTPIQHQVIPAALEGKDIVGVAQTGTGKTLAFGIPMIQRIALYKGQGLVLVPTRELAIQVQESLKQIGSSLGLRCVVVIGGVSQHSQVRDLKNNPHIVIATPGRLADLMEQGVYKLDRLSVITLDEADRMLDMGFLPQIKGILQKAPKERQTMLFSATMPKTISSLASTFMKIPLRIEIAPQGTSSENIEQEIFVVKKNDKMRLLDSILQQYGKDKTLIFSRTKHGAKRIARDIRNMGHTSTEIHGNRSQAQRKLALEGFTRDRFRVMVATDIAARGIDVKDISLVINFDLPDNSEDYVHRIGRTGRAGRFGKAISFVTPSEKADIRRIEALIRKSLPILSLPELPPEREKPLQEEGTRFSGHEEFGGRRRGGNFSHPKRRKGGFGKRKPSSGGRNSGRRRG